MSKSKLYRWKCPTCGSTKLASSRPRKRATVRFCLGCSETEGTLVERTCPVLDAKRLAKGEKRHAKQEVQLAVKATRETFSGIHVPTEMKSQIKRLRAAGVFIRTRKVDLVIRRSSRPGISGHAKVRYDEVVLSIGASSKGKIREVILHELCHVECPEDVHHGDAFRSKLAEGARVLWGVVIKQPAPHIYTYDEQIVTVLDQREDEE